jgi:single-stranded-DNA-specific exonuclease
MTHWLDPKPIDVPSALRDTVGGHPLVAETLARRGILTPDAARAFLYPASYLPASPMDLPDLAAAVERLHLAIRRGERVAVWGDFDADGQTATALLLETLRNLGAEVTFHVPARHEGHGLHIEGLKRLITGGTSLILTCDTGVTAHAAVAQANALRAEVIVTDHHVPRESLPPAVAVVNPHRLPAGHPMATLPGVGVAYELARGLDPSMANRALDLVALGTVADVATLTGDARYLVQLGLEALRHTERPGLQAVYEAADLRPEGITEEHIGFVLGPRLNALGRLADASHGVELLTTTDRTRARVLATEVEGLNSRRRWYTKQVTDAALAQIEREPSLLRGQNVITLSHPTWPSGVVGIVAGRLAERYGRPAVLINAPEGKLARGSGRSVPGIDLIGALTECATLLESFGGHAGAAGFAIEPERIPELRAALSRAVAAQVKVIPKPTLTVDAYVELTQLTLDLVAEINRLAPFGHGNPPLTLAVRDLRILSEATIGGNAEHRRLTVEDARDRTQTVFWWHGADWSLPRGRFDLAVSVRASDYRGVAEIQVEWLDAREREPAAAELLVSPDVKVFDHRTVSNPETVLRELVEGTGGELQVWAEADEPAGIEAKNRLQLTPGPRLVVWTLPPGPRELRAALDAVEPEEVILFAQDPAMDVARAFLQRLAGLVKSALRSRDGQMDLQEAAAATAHRVATVRAGLEWLATQGQVAIAERGDGVWWLVTSDSRVGPELADRTRAHLEDLLKETAAYREHVLDAPAEALVP